VYRTMVPPIRRSTERSRYTGAALCCTVRATHMNEAIRSVHDFWDEASCGENLYLEGDDKQGYDAQAAKRYELEPFILALARPSDTRDRDVLEIGVGLGADHQRFAEAGARLCGIDLTERAVEHTRRRLQLFGLASTLRVANAEALPFADESFDVVYSWGVLHHSPDTPKAVVEAWRVLRPGGSVRAMIYHRRSLVGYMLWTRYALLTGRPWRSLADVYATHLESPGTKAYSIDEAQRLFNRFATVKIRTVLTHGDLLDSGAGQRHGGPALSIARRLWPRALLRRLFPGHGLFMLIEGTK
jgi:SAM-dependent methyltransferase